MLLRLDSLAWRARSVSPRGPCMKSRSKTSRGEISLDIGVRGVRHEMLALYAQEYPESQLPAVAPRSQPNSSEENLVLPLRAEAAT